MDLIDRSEVIKSLFDYTKGKKTIGQCIDDVPTVDVVPMSVIEKIKAEIVRLYAGCSICIWDNDYFCDDDASEYMPVGKISDILQIIDRKVKEHTK